MRLIFAGTPEFARIALARLHAAGFEIALVLTQPDRPSGRGQKLQASSVKQYALEHGMTVAQPRSLRLDGQFANDALAARAALEAAQADAMVVAAYGLILPQWVLSMMSAAAPDSPNPGGGDHKLGCFNIHASLLPRWRGAAPIHRAIEAGDRETGVTIMQMDAGLDTGDMLLVGKLPIADTDTSASLHDKLAPLGADLMVQTLRLAATQSLQPRAQPVDGVTYAQKIEKHEAAIDWSQSAAGIARQIRAFNPFPGASATLRGETLKLWTATAAPATHPSGTACGTVLDVTAAGIAVAATDSVLTITELQRAGGKRLRWADFLRGFDLRAGMAFEKRDDPCSS